MENFEVGYKLNGSYQDYGFVAIVKNRMSLKNRYVNNEYVGDILEDTDETLFIHGGSCVESKSFDHTKTNTSWHMVQQGRVNVLFETNTKALNAVKEYIKVCNKCVDEHNKTAQKCGLEMKEYFKEEDLLIKIATIKCVVSMEII